MENDIKNDINIKLNISDLNNPLFLAINSAITINKLKFKSDEELDLFITEFIYNNLLIAKRIKFKLRGVLRVAEPRWFCKRGGRKF